MNKSIFELRGQNPGPTVAIIAGIHGNEKTGVLALQKIMPSLQLKAGTLFVIFANPPALKRNVRQIKKNLNRCFDPDNKGGSYEDKRAQQIMKILDICDACLDLHAYNEPDGVPFVMTESLGINIAKIFDVSIISTGWANTEPGTTDTYMFLRGKVGLCLECGPISQAKKFMSSAEKSILQFLTFYEMLESPVNLSYTTHKIIHATKSLVRTSEDFWLDPSLKSFQKLEPGHAFARHSGEDWVAQTGEYIIFPRPQANIGAEAFILGEELS